MVATVKSSLLLAGTDAVRQLHLADVDGIADLQPVERDMDLARDVRCIADDLELVDDDVENAAALQARRASSLSNRIGTATFTLVCSLMRRKSTWIGRLLTGWKSTAFGSVRVGLPDIDHHDRVHEVAGRKHLRKELLLDMDREGSFFWPYTTAGTRPSRRSSREAPLPARSRVSAGSVSCSLISLVLQ